MSEQQTELLKSIVHPLGKVGKAAIFHAGCYLVGYGCVTLAESGKFGTAIQHGVTSILGKLEM